MVSNAVKSMVLESGKGISIKFQDDIIYALNFSDFSESYLTGSSTQIELLKNKNFLQSKIEYFSLSNLEFDGCDFLDTIMFSCTFKNCLLTRQHFTSCKIEKVRFIECELSETNHQNSTFDSCEFIGCNFHNILMKSCSFINCTFIDCQTSNKLFESCLLLNCSYERMELQTQTIVENFGLTKRQCHEVIFRNKRKRENFTSYSIEDICIQKNEISTDNVGFFLYNYFRYEISIQTYEALFSSIDDPNWINKGASHSIIKKIENLSSFLIFLYEKDDVFFLPILKLNDLIFKLNEHIKAINTLETKAMSRALYGVRHELSEKVAIFIKYVDLIVNNFFDGEEITFIAIGPLKCDYYQRLFEHLGNDCQIIAVYPQNSPNFIKAVVKFTASWAFIALILSTRFEHSLKSISGDIAENIKETEKGLNKLISIDESLSLPSNTVNLKSYELSIGPLETDGGEIGFQMISVFTNGMTEKLKLSISPKRALDLHETIIGFATDKTKKRKV